VRKNYLVSRKSFTGLPRLKLAVLQIGGRLAAITKCSIVQESR